MADVDDEKLKALREAWLDVPFLGTVNVGTGEWLQTLINATSAIVDPERTLRDTDEAQRRGRLAGYRSRHAFSVEQVRLSNEHGMAAEAERHGARASQEVADCLAEFGVDLRG